MTTDVSFWNKFTSLLAYHPWEDAARLANEWVEEQKMITELQCVWKGIGPDVLQAAEFDGQKPEFLGQEIQNIVADHASLHLSAEAQKVWKIYSFEKRQELLKKAFPDTELYGW